MDGVIELLSEGSFIKFNVRVAQTCGTDAAIVLGKLCTLAQLYGNPFFYELEKMEAETTLSVFKIRKALKVLQEHELINIELKGIPARNYYQLNSGKLNELLITRCEKIKPQMFKNLTSGSEKIKHLYNIDIKNIDNNNIDINNNKKTLTTSVESLIDGVECVELRQALNDFCKMRKSIKKPVTVRAMQILLNKLDKMAENDKDKISILEQSIEHCWQSVYPLKADTTADTSNPFVKYI